MTDPNPYPKADYGRNTNSPEVLIIGAGISGEYWQERNILPVM